MDPRFSNSSTDSGTSTGAVVLRFPTGDLMPSTGVRELALCSPGRLPVSARPTRRARPLQVLPTTQPSLSR